MKLSHQQTIILHEWFQLLARDQLKWCESRWMQCNSARCPLSWNMKISMETYSFDPLACSIPMNESCNETVFIGSVSFEMNWIVHDELKLTWLNKIFNGNSPIIASNASPASLIFVIKLVFSLDSIIPFVLASAVPSYIKANASNYK